MMSEARIVSLRNTTDMTALAAGEKQSHYHALACSTAQSSSKNSFLEIYSSRRGLSIMDAIELCIGVLDCVGRNGPPHIISPIVRSEEHTSELQSR